MREVESPRCFDLAAHNVLLTRLSTSTCQSFTSNWRVPISSQAALIENGTLRESGGQRGKEWTERKRWEGIIKIITIVVWSASSVRGTVKFFVNSLKPPKEPCGKNRLILCPLTRGIEGPVLQNNKEQTLGSSPSSLRLSLSLSLRVCHFSSFSS